MCGRYIVRRIDAQRFGIDPATLPLVEEFSEHGFKPRFNIAPSQDVAVVRINHNGDRVLGFVRWGLIPHWSKTKPKVQPINARAETVPTSGMFKQAFARRRCLIPADGFYEWRKTEAGKQPMFIHLPGDEPFAFAGLWERWKPAEDAEPLDTCTIITTTPNALMETIHNRMPVIVKPEDYNAWMNRDLPPDEAAKLMRPYPDGELVAEPVSTLVNSPRNDVPECVKSITDEPGQ
jgi:putative SOS response-associated peptidase YedK